MSQTLRAGARDHSHDEDLARHLVTDAAGRLFVTYWASLVVVDVTRSEGPATVAVLLAGLVALVSVRQRPWVAVGLACVAWLFVTGFVANGSGSLALHDAGDVTRLVLLVGVATAAATATNVRKQR